MFQRPRLSCALYAATPLEVNSTHEAIDFRMLTTVFFVLFLTFFLPCCHISLY